MGTQVCRRPQICSRGANYQRTRPQTSFCKVLSRRQFVSRNHHLASSLKKSLPSVLPTRNLVQLFLESCIIPLSYMTPRHRQSKGNRMGCWYIAVERRRYDIPIRARPLGRAAQCLPRTYGSHHIPYEHDELSHWWFLWQQSLAKRSHSREMFRDSRRVHRVVSMDDHARMYRGLYGICLFSVAHGSYDTLRACRPCPQEYHRKRIDDYWYRGLGTVGVLSGLWEVRPYA
ncbi:hypothetical protein IW262DRAFT_148388 [Armillaria fumosa]|nr:hypothetical protein IW262DRAFT_148388 [Armillaria fumosa]